MRDAYHTFVGFTSQIPKDGPETSENAIKPTGTRIG